jgi:hypothetical protein
MHCRGESEGWHNAVADDLLAKQLREHGLELLLKQNFYRLTQQRGPQPHAAGEDARDQHPRVHSEAE